MDVASLVMSVLALLVSIGSAYQSNKRAEEATRKVDEANRISHAANELAQSANVYASENNIVSSQGVGISQKTYENQYIPKITFRYGSSGDLTTNPPTKCFLISVANEGYIPVLIQWVGFWIVGSDVTAPVFTLDVIQNRQPPLLPAELLPGRVLDIRIPIDNFRDNLQFNAKSRDDEFTIRLMQQTGQYFETARFKVKDYVEHELPVRVRLHEGPTPFLAENEKPPLGGD